MLNQEDFQSKLIAVIVTYFPSISLLDNIKKLEKECNEILIVDNGSANESAEIIKEIEKREKVTVHYCRKNLGIAEALNIGLNYAFENNYEWLLTFDQDSVLITESYAYTLLSVTNRDFNIEVVAVMGGNYPKPVDPKFPDLDRYPPATGKISCREVNTLITSGNLLNLNVIKKSGISFNEDFFIDYVDYDFCLAIKAAGYRIIQVLEARFEHTIGNPVYKNWRGKRVFIHNHNYKRKYYIIRNSYIVHQKHSYNSQWVKWSKKFVHSQIKNTILFENQKIKKLLAILLGVIDAKRGKMGAWSYKI